MSRTPTNQQEPWLVRLSRTRADLAIAAAILLAFFFYKGGLVLLAWLIILFALLLTLSRLFSWALGKRHPHKSDPNSLEKGQEENREQLGGDSSKPGAS